MKAHDHPYFAGRFVAMAHRGGPQLAGNEGIENTMAAFERAVALGYQWLETDVHTTADGVLVAFHDERLDRVTDRTGAIAELSWDEVSAARVGGTEPIPRFDELLDAFDVRVNVDIKAPGAVEPLAAAIERHRAHDRVCVGSFDGRRLTDFRRRIGTRVPTAVRPAGVVWTALAPALASRVNDAGVVFQVPVNHVVKGRALPIVTPRFIEAAHAGGRQVHVWTINEAAEMERLIDLGVDGLITDRPDTLAEVLRRRTLW